MDAVRGFLNRLVTLQSEHKAAASRAHIRLNTTVAGRYITLPRTAILAREEIATDQFEAAFAEFMVAGDIARSKGVREDEIERGLRNAVVDVVQHMRALLCIGGGFGASPEHFDHLLGRAESLLVQYRDGYISGSGAPSFASQNPAMMIDVSNSHGVTIQQGGQGNSQHVEMTLNIQEARQALNVLSAEVGKAAGPCEDIDEVLRDLDALQHELDRRTPNPTLARELAKSARNIIEGTLGGVLSAAALAAAPQLWSALGIG